MTALTTVTVQDSLPSDLFTAQIPESHAGMLINRGTLKSAPVYTWVDGAVQETGTRWEISNWAFIEYIQEVAL